MRSVEISVVSPVYKGETFVDELVARCESTLEQICESYEIILVEDCGPDGSWEKIVEICKSNPKVRGLRLSRNYGQQYALQAGLDASFGDYVVTLDCDLQDRPEEIISLYEKAKTGYDIVAAKRGNRKDGAFKRYASHVFYQLMSYLTETNQDPSVANFVLYSRRAVDAMAQIGDYRRYYPILPQLIGFDYATVVVVHAERPEGNSSYSIKARLNLAVDTILNFSNKPLRLAVKFGVLLSFLSILAAFVLVGLYAVGNINVQGWTSLALLLSFFSGAIVSVLGMVGLYVGQIFESVKNRPSYIVRESLN
jgi:dolichol-phosphate mannosyltransferase